ncbi:membrane-bound lytic murein transglycosylase D [Sinobacterium caligoides]|uniref:Membrane-bound lytic murein transglycosylase D n=1 Tax=Sinobacterium caligoides TaxID=933926 RepID=A0A3N2DJM7_9GAMM|nr:LysM peptidoglycan-binding domain-containing protein [Sinobacterium caligoides]ROR99986.1 membrane-bound lytic murein transglycosylase D [Sinobacterium caligoides]
MPNISRPFIRLLTCSSITILIACSPIKQNSDLTTVKDEKFKLDEQQSRYTVKSKNNCRPSEQQQGDDYQAVYYDDVWQRLRDNFKLDRELNRPEVQAQIAAFKHKPHSLQRISKKASPYLFHIANRIEEKGLPMELALLPVIESAYNPFAHSYARASGMWQFMPNTGRIFGLKQDWWYDGRRDIISSTDAALSYFEELTKRYDGDWPLALAAYNSGMGTVDRAIKRNRAAGKPTDYWSLSLPRETKRYVPKLLALAEIFSHPQRYNITLAPVDNTPFFVAVDVGSQIDISQAAKMAGLPNKQLRQLNPAFNRWATDPHGRHELLIPIDNVDNFQRELAKLDPSKRVSWDHYKVRSGDSLGLIAQRHQTTVQTLQTVNKINGNLIRVGQLLMIPLNNDGTSLGANSDYASKSKTATTKRYHTVRSGESLWTIAKRNGVNIRQLASWNNMGTRDTLSVGKKLVLLSPSADSTQKLGYKVKRGDSLARIAGNFNVKVNDIVRWNTLSKEAYIQPGQHLTLYVQASN